MVDEQRCDADLVDADFEVLFERHAVTIHRYLARRIGTTTADDLLAQTFLVAYERRAKYDRSRPDARPWLYGIATNLLRRHFRDETRQYQALARTGIDPVLAAAAESHDQRVAGKADADACSTRLAAGLADLSPPDREVLLLFAWGGFSYSEIAASLDIPIGTVRSRLHRARRVLRAAFPDLEGDNSWTT